MSLDVSIDPRSLEEDARLLVTQLLTEAGAAVATQTRGLERDLEQLTKGNVRGKLWRAWKSDVFPRKGVPAYAPKGEVFVNGEKRTRGAMTYWTEPGVTKARSGRFLAIPTDAAGVNNRSRSMTPKDWERDHGIKLKVVPGRNGKAARLVAEQVVIGRNGTGVRRATSRRMQGNYARASVIVTTIFVLIPLQQFANRFAIEPAHQRRLKMLAEDIQSRFDRLAAT